MTDIDFQYRSFLRFDVIQEYFLDKKWIFGSNKVYQ